MITANELRIGNWIECLLLGNYQLKSGDIETDKAKEIYKPIPITPEILKKAGFTEHCEGNEYRIGLPLGNGTDLVIEVLQMETGPYDALISDTTADQKVNCYSYAKPVKSLHQLQNLYFALTGTELTIEL